MAAVFTHGRWPDLILVAPEDRSQVFQVRRRAFIHHLPVYVDNVFEIVGEHACGEPICIAGADADTVRCLADWLHHGTLLLSNTNAVTQDERDAESLRIVRLFHFAEHWALPKLQNIAMQHFDERTAEFGLSPVVVKSVFRGWYNESPLRRFVFEFLAGHLARGFCWPQDATGWPGLVELERLTEGLPGLKAGVIKHVTAHMQNLQLSDLQNFFANKGGIESAGRSSKKRKLGN